MTTVFLLWHTHTDERLSGGEDVKLLGTFSSHEKAMAAQLQASQTEGFRDNLDGFEISEYEIDQPQWTEGFVTEIHGAANPRCFIGEVGHWIMVDGKVNKKHNYEYRTLMMWASDESVAKQQFENEAFSYGKPYKNMFGQDVCYVFDKVHFVRESWFFDDKKMNQGEVLEVDSHLKQRQYPAKGTKPINADELPKAPADNEFYNLLSHWRTFAERYASTETYIYEWQNHMDARRLIAEKLSQQPHDQRALLRHIRHYDKMVLNQTFEVNECIWGADQGYDRRTHWYYFRLNQRVFEIENSFTKRL
jgi:hypothetical protein